MPDGDKAGSCRCSEKDYRHSFSKARALLARQPPAMSTVVRADPAEAYLHACLAAPFFFYVSPATYGLADNVTTDEKGIERKATLPGDEV